MRNALIAAIVAAIVGSSSAVAATSINGRWIADHSIPVNKLTLKAAAALKGKPGPRGLTSAVSPSVIDYEKVTVDITTEPQTVQALCPAGYIVIGGGFQTLSGGLIVENEWLPDETGWEVTSYITPGYGNQLTVYASCEPSQ